MHCTAEEIREKPLEWTKLPSNLPRSRTAYHLSAALQDDTAWRYVAHLYTCCADAPARLARWRGTHAVAALEGELAWRGERGALVAALVDAEELAWEDDGLFACGWWKLNKGTLHAKIRDAKREDGRTRYLDKPLAALESQGQSDKNVATDDSSRAGVRRVEREKEEATTYAAPPAPLAEVAVEKSTELSGEKKPRGKKPRHPVDPPPSDEEHSSCLAVFQRWRELHPRVKKPMTATDEGLVVTRLREGYDEATLLSAVEGHSLSDFHHGQSGKRFIGLEYALREKNIPGFVEAAQARADELDLLARPTVAKLETACPAAPGEEALAVELWQGVCDALREDGKTYALEWLERMRGFRVDPSDTLQVQVPDRFFREWVDDHYRGLCEASLAERTEGRVLRWELVVIEAAH